jgi:hypothetical protein
MTKKKIITVLLLLGLITTISFAAQRSRGMYKCTDDSVDRAYVQITYSSSSKQATIKWYDSNKRPFQAVRTSFANDTGEFSTSNPNQLVISVSEASMPYILYVDDKTIRFSGNGKTYTQVHDFTYDQ